MKNIQIIDNHCHLNFDDYNQDREDVIKRATEKGVGMIVVGTNKKTSERAVELAQKYSNIWAIVGLHPIYAHEEITVGDGFDYDFYNKLAKDNKVVGIGECGFDYFHYAQNVNNKEKISGNIEAFKKSQEEAFISQIDLANKINKPLMLHIRNAYDDALLILKNHAKVIGNAHFFAGDINHAKTFLDMGYNLSWTGVITFTDDYNEIIKYVPKDRILSETDAPYVAPLPHRGKRNEPSYVEYVVQKMAYIRDEKYGDFKSQLLENSKKIFIKSI